ncbi:MAG TPA: hypothetical protein VFU47_02500 [Armatimonadota bacterium]|nr:hypothetical protein [Armatimonadota bacterium]
MGLLVAIRRWLMATREELKAKLAEITAAASKKHGEVEALRAEVTQAHATIDDQARTIQVLQSRVDELENAPAPTVDLQEELDQAEAVRAQVEGI